MFTFWCRHGISVWQSTESFLLVIKKSNIMLHWQLRNTQCQTVHYIIHTQLYKYLPTREHTLTT